MSNKNRAPAHQNQFAYKHNKGSKLTKKILQLPNEGLCQRCHEQIEWRKRYRKYKPLSQPAKCIECHDRTVVHAYHQICESCVTKKDVCAKCLKKADIIIPLGQKEKDKEDEKELLNESQRKTVLRLTSKKKKEGEEQVDVAVLIDEYIAKNKARRKHDDLDDFDDFGDNDLDDLGDEADSDDSNGDP